MIILLQGDDHALSINFLAIYLSQQLTDSFIDYPTENKKNYQKINSLIKELQ